MQWISDNIVLLVFGGAMVAMHLFGHGHGRKGRPHGSDHAPDEQSADAGPDAPGQTGDDRHG